jgi:hypothetical protein
VNPNSLAAIKRRVRVGQRYEVTNHGADPFHGPVRVVVTQAFDTRFLVQHALGETRIGWPPARYVRRDEDGTLHLLGIGEHAGLPFLTLVPLAATAAGEDQQ